VITYSGGKVGTDKKTITMVATEMGLDREKTNAENKLKINAEAKERYLAILFFLGADRQYVRLLENTENNFLQGSKTYPKTVNAAHNLLLSYNQEPRNLIKMVGNINDGILSRLPQVNKKRR